MSNEEHDELNLNEVKITLAALAGEIVASFICTTCEWTDEFELSQGLPSTCPRCRDRNSLVVQ